MQSLQPFHTFNIPANAREIIEATSIEQIQQAWQKAQAENLPVLFLGQGSNMLFLDDFQGGMRMLEKEAVRIGGGTNHRIGLFDMILLKDNHIDFCGGVHNAISRAKAYCKANGKNLKIECEVRNFKELDEALTEGCDRIMFDNFSPEDTRIAVDIVAGRCETESSGGITYETMIPYAKAGVDFISFGALTHSVKGLDMSFKAAGSDKLVMK